MVTVDGNAVTLTFKEFELLCYLMENKGMVLTRDQLLSKIWGYDFDGETRTVVWSISGHYDRSWARPAAALRPSAESAISWR